MLAKPIYDYFWFGTCVRYLQDASKGFPIHELGIIFNIEQFLMNIDSLGCSVTARLTGEIEVIVADLKNEPAEATLTQHQAENLSNAIKKIRDTLQAELAGMEAFILTPKILDVKRLFGDVPSLVAPSRFAQLPDIARYDFTEAGKCIAFERPTAAAFHVLRATESVLRHFYCSMVRQQRVKHQNWGDILKDLRKRRKTKQYEVLYNNLDNIRLSFRNPTQHPEKVYDIQEAQDLWSLCVEVVNRMASTNLT